MIFQYIKSTIIVNTVQFLSLSVIALRLSTESYGDFRIMYAYWLSAVAIGMLGFNQSLIREINWIEDKARPHLLKAIKLLLIAASIILAPITLLLTNKFSINSIWLGVSLAINIYAYAYFCMLSSLFQARGDEPRLLKVQTYSKSLVFIGAVIGGITNDSDYIFLGISISYIILHRVLKNEIEILFLATDNITWRSLDLKPLYLLISKSLWPWLLAVTAAISQHIEFFSSALIAIDDDSVGKFAYANLLFMGATALFFSFQNHALTKFANKLLPIKSLIKYQFATTVLMLLPCAGIYFLSLGLNYYDQQKFDSEFLHYVDLIIVKLLAWSLICISGSLLYYYDHGKMSFFIGLLPIIAVIIVTNIWPSFDAIVLAQLASYLISAFMIWFFLFKGEVK